MARFDRHDVIPAVVAALIVAALLVWGYIALVPPAGAATETFDHSDCQYPNRKSNPPDGCDNSDPARPECMKIGIEDCDLPLQDGSTSTNQAIVDPAASTQATVPKSVTCTGN
jgi:hypothetical protein